MGFLFVLGECGGVFGYFLTSVRSDTAAAIGQLQLSQASKALFTAFGPLELERVYRMNPEAMDTHSQCTLTCCPDRYWYDGIYGV